MSVVPWMDPKSANVSVPVFYLMQKLITAFKLYLNYFFIYLASCFIGRIHCG